MAANNNVSTIDSSVNVVFIAGGLVSVSVAEQASNNFPKCADYPRLH